MTDNEIIKALERCSTTMAGECKECPLYKQVDNCTSKLTKDALDLINRQKAEIERLEQVVSIKQKNKRTIKSEAIKEFIQKHREMMMAFCDDDDQISLKVCEYDANTNNLVKEIIEV